MKILINKMKKEVEIDFPNLPQRSQEYIINYGLKQALNDPLAGITDAAEIEGKLAMRMDALQNGTVGLLRSRISLPPLEALALRIAKTKLRKHFKGQKIDPKELEEKAAEFAKDPRLVKIAQAQLDAQKALADVNVVFGE